MYVSVSYGATHPKRGKINGSHWLALEDFRIAHFACGLHKSPSDAPHQSIESWVEEQEFSSFWFWIREDNHAMWGGKEFGKWAIAEMLVQEGWSIRVQGRRDRERIAGVFANLRVAHDNAIAKGELDF
jgi:hypothetical protein